MRLRKIFKVIAAIIILLSIAGRVFEYLHLSKTLLIVLPMIAIWIAEYYFFDRNFIPRSSNFELDLEEVRELAGTVKCNLPIRLNSLIVAIGEIPDWIVVAGGTPHGFPISFTSFQVVYENKTVIIECPFNKTLYDKFCQFEFLGIKGKSFHEENFEIMQKAMLEADCIIATHEHWDHVGGIAQSPYLEELMKKSVLTSEQIYSKTIKDAGFPNGIFDDVFPLEYDQYHVLAPGIVLIKAPGHSVGSQMIFIKLHDGTEYLFVGDIGWNMINIEQLTNHSRIGMFLRHENGKQLGHLIRWLYENICQNPNNNVILLTSHDLGQLENYRRTGLIGDSFE